MEPGAPATDSSTAALAIDRAGRRASVHGPLALEPRAFDLLAELAAHPGEVLAKAVLFERVWGRRVVGDAALSQAVARIRRELARAGGEADWIRTVHGVGYAFDGPLLATDPPAPASAASPTHPAPTPSPASPAPAAVRRPSPMLALLAVLLALVAWGLWRDAAEPEPPSLAIAPFEFDARADGLDYGELALPRLLGDVLAERTGITVVPPERVRRGLANLQLPDDADEAAQAQAIRELFGVDHVLFARLDRREDGLGLAWRLHPAGPEAGPGRASAPGIGAVLDDAAGALSGELDVAYAAGIPVRRLWSDEFVNEAFARGLQALLSGELPAAERYFDAALEDAPEAGWIHYERGNARSQQGRFDDAAADFHRALELGAADGDGNLAGVAETGLGLVDWRGGRLDEAAQRFQRARALFEAAGNRANLAAALGNLGILADNRGELDAARELYEQALALYREQGERAGESAVYSNLAVIARRQGRLDRAAELQQRALEIQTRAGLGQMRVFSATHLAEIERRRGAWEHAATLLDGAAADAERAADRLGAADVAATRAALLADIGDEVGAEAQEAEALSAYAALGHRFGEMRVRLQRAARLAGREDTVASADATRALALARELGDRHTELRAMLLRASLGANDGEAAIAAALAHAQPRDDALLEAEARRTAAALGLDADGLHAAYRAAGRSGDPREQALLALELGRRQLAAGETDGLDALLGRVEAWRIDHPQALALRACRERLAGRLAEADRLEALAASGPGARVAAGWCPTAPPD